MSPVAVQFYTCSHDAWRVMLEDINKAKRSIVLEQYIFNPDSIGQQFIDLLRRKAKEGVRVRLLCDMFGSYSLYSSFYPEYLRKEGVEVRFFNQISPWRVTNFTSNFFRDHRKILVVDDEIAHVGGVGIDEEMRMWRDTHMRITGPIVESIKASFETVWEGVRMGFYIRYQKPSAFIRKYELLTNAPSLRQRYIYQTLISQIRNARRYVYIMTPYFIPDVPMYRALRLAAKRGVDVRIIVPEVADHLFVNHARESYFTLALKAGIKIYVYTPTMMHAKVAIIDDVWATTGSFNIHSLSFYFNHEANIASTDQSFITEIKSQFERDLGVSRQIAFEEWIKRPLRKKILELLTWPFHGVM